VGKASRRRRERRCQVEEFEIVSVQDLRARLEENGSATVMVPYVEQQAPGAWPQGTRIRKIRSDPSDGHPAGTLGLVVGSIGPMEFQSVPDVYGYFVYWDPMPTVPVLVVSTAIVKVTDQPAA
jgi:hypothetical protein